MYDVEKSERGVCPKCGSHNLDYENMEPDGECVYWEVYCRDCDWEGEEWYDLKFVCYYSKEKLERKEESGKENYANIRDSNRPAGGDAIC